jgi:putative ABC transport system permease protein
MGANLLVVRAGARQSGGAFTGTQQNLKTEDAEAILRQVKDITMVAPEVSNRYQVKYMNKNSSVNVSGEPVTYFPVRNFVVEKGRAFTEAEVNRNSKVAVLGPKTVTDLFGDMDPIGEQIKLKGVNFTVVGVTKSKGDQGWFNPDDQIIIPLTTAMVQMMGRDYLGSIYLQVKDGADMTKVQDDVTAVLRRQHRLQVGAPDDFNIRNLQEMVDSLNQVSSVFTYLLAGVASVSLLVGGIGIMNIMLVTVTERTREIGIRKALGARNFDVLTQFLLEAVVVSLSGGILGVSFGLGSIFSFNKLMTRFGDSSMTAKMEMWPVALAFGFSVLVGIFFGWYPARKAASLDPIEALRYE